MTHTLSLSARIAALEAEAAPLEQLREEYQALNGRLDQLDDLIEAARKARERLAQIEVWCGDDWPGPATTTAPLVDVETAQAPEAVVVDITPDEQATESPEEPAPADSTEQEAPPLWADTDLTAAQRVLLYLEEHPAQTAVNIAARIGIPLATAASTCSTLQRTGQLEARDEKPRLYSIKSAPPFPQAKVEEAPTSEETPSLPELNMDEQAVLGHLREGGLFTDLLLARKMGVALSRVNRACQRLVHLKLARTKGPGFEAVIPPQQAAD